MRWKDFTVSDLGETGRPVLANDGTFGAVPTVRAGGRPSRVAPGVAAPNGPRGRKLEPIAGFVIGDFLIACPFAPSLTTGGFDTTGLLAPGIAATGLRMIGALVPVFAIGGLGADRFRTAG